jgi:hypothetical protein
MNVISRAEAKAAGLRFYRTGKECKYGHSSDRFVINGSCVVCQERLKVEYRVANRDKATSRAAAWRAANPDKVKAQNAKRAPKTKAPKQRDLKCGADGCDLPAVCFGYCDKHYRRLRKNGSVSDADCSRHVSDGDDVERFHDKYMPEPNSGCWLWLAGTRPNSRGALYGRHFTDDGRSVGAHRFSYWLHIGSIPDGMHVCHKCDNTLCVNPDHLFLGTPDDNAKDMVRKGRSYRGLGEKKGSAKLTDAEAAIVKRSAGSQGAIAERFGVSQATVGRIKRGERYAP